MHDLTYTLENFKLALSWPACDASTLYLTVFCGFYVFIFRHRIEKINSENHLIG